MSTLRILFVLALVSFTTLLSAQTENPTGNLQFKLEMMSDQTWGVFVKPDHSITPSARTKTGSGQVTIVAPVAFSYANFENHAGTWVENARVNGPIEASDKAYVSFGFVTDNPKIQLIPNEETLLFTFTTAEEFHGTFQLIENNDDPFATPNSYGTNPGNDLGMIDCGVQGGIQFYTYAGNIYPANQAIIASNIIDKNNKRVNRKARAVFTSGDDETLTLKPE